jgi:hypothetical protein
MSDSYPMEGKSNLAPMAAAPCSDGVLRSGQVFVRTGFHRWWPSAQRLNGPLVVCDPDSRLTRTGMTIESSPDKPEKPRRVRNRGTAGILKAAKEIGYEVVFQGNSVIARPPSNSDAPSSEAGQSNPWDSVLET